MPSKSRGGPSAPNRPRLSQVSTWWSRARKRSHGSQISAGIPQADTSTTPRQGARTRELALAAVSCQAYHDGYFTAYRHLAAEDVDVVLHLGDYLYEYAVNGAGGARNYT
ncbi:alkaline phosphatase D family protein, partial [Streptomyces sp. NPDC057148]|uniref:alkaline phosphatase D family protein n=1 Tax=Streptomyces sp. NPDC057148 TaxID=3346035 RepID=UPI00362EC6E2